MGRRSLRGRVFPLQDSRTWRRYEGEVRLRGHVVLNGPPRHPCSSQRLRSARRRALLLAGLPAPANRELSYLHVHAGFHVEPYRQTQRCSELGIVHPGVPKEKAKKARRQKHERAGTRVQSAPLAAPGAPSTSAMGRTLVPDAAHTSRAKGPTISIPKRRIFHPHHRHAMQISLASGRRRGGS